VPELGATQRVSRGHPCPVCGRPDWCLIARAGRYAVCMRVESDRPARSRSGGWVHRLDTSHSAGAWSDPPPAPATSPAPVASLERRDRVYRRLLQAAPLSARHRLELEARGYSPDELRCRTYGSLELRGRARLARRCAEGADDLAGVPGFWVAEQDQRPYWTLAGPPGLLIPCLDPNKKVRGLRIRPDCPDRAGGKYVWLSSKTKPGGVGSGLHCHVAQPTFPPRVEGEVWVVEGEIKADLAAERLGSLTVSIPGVAAWGLALEDLGLLLPCGGTVVVALDADWRENSQVHQAVWGLAQACTGLGYRVEVALWEMTHKGLDDLLQAGLRPRRTAPTELPAPPWAPKISSRPLAWLPPGQGKRQPAWTLAEARERLRETLASLFPSS
jgi:hypothetical protein